MYRIANIWVVSIIVLVTGLFSDPVWCDDEQGNPGDVLSLEQAIQTAVGNNPRIDIAEEKINELRGTIKVVMAPYLPDLKFTAQYMRFRDPSILNSSSFSDITDDLPFDLTPEAQNTYNITLSLDQPVYTWGKRKSALSGARLAVEQSEFDLITAQQNLAYDVAVTYYGVVLAEKNLDVLETTRKFQEAFVDVSRDRFDAGLAKELDVLKAESALASLLPTILSAQNTIRIRKVRLNQLLGKDGDAPVTVTESFPDDEKIVIATEEIISTAFQRRSELNSVDILSKIYREAIKISRAGTKPSVRFSGNYGQSAALFENIIDNDFRSWSIMVNFEWPLYDGRFSKGEVEQYTAMLMQTLNNLELQKDLIALESRQAYYDYEDAQNLLRASKIAYEAAKKELESAKDAYAAGTASTLDVLDSRRALSVAEFAVIQSRYKLALATVALKKAMGYPLTGRLPISNLSEDDKS